ncbi:Uncharacterized protein FWK35_00018112 [Aphis craccivora]|uniref:Reverse transcriptase domain-containing protein n=1 Tax=Aphis craccivora TaxID=307492 RepID=A0A6G0Y1I8_APHCR|nr:Uncharacterized protein FWK35_00018112 [Aphis craccivora]
MHQPPIWPASRPTGEVPLITAAELALIGTRLPTNKAPGLDGVPDIILKRIIVKKTRANIRHAQQVSVTGLFPETMEGSHAGAITEGRRIEKAMELVNKAGTGPLYKRELCAMVCLDVANAFNSAPWVNIEEALLKKKVPEYMCILRNYLNERAIIYGDTTRRAVTSGVPQGSVLRPIL